MINYTLNANWSYHVSDAYFALIFMSWHTYSFSFGWHAVSSLLHDIEFFQLLKMARVNGKLSETNEWLKWLVLICPAIFSYLCILETLLKSKGWAGWWRRKAIFLPEIVVRFFRTHYGFLCPSSFLHIFLLYLLK